MRAEICPQRGQRFGAPLHRLKRVQRGYSLPLYSSIKRNSDATAYNWYRTGGDYAPSLPSGAGCWASPVQREPFHSFAPAVPNQMMTDSGNRWSTAALSRLVVSDSAMHQCRRGKRCYGWCRKVQNCRRAVGSQVHTVLVTVKPRCMLPPVTGHAGQSSICHGVTAACSIASTKSVLLLENFY